SRKVSNSEYIWTTAWERAAELLLFLMVIADMAARPSMPIASTRTAIMTSSSELPRWRFRGAETGTGEKVLCISIGHEALLAGAAQSEVPARSLTDTRLTATCTSRVLRSGGSLLLHTPRPPWR